MFSKVKIAAAVSLICLGFASSAALAAGSSVINGNFTYLNEDLSACGDTTGVTWDGVTATLKVKQIGATSHVEVELEGGRPNTLYTMWLRLRGTVTATGVSFGASPITGLPVTAFAPGSALAGLMAVSPPYPGTPVAVNGFTTDANGDGEFMGEMDFPLVGGAYPFNLADKPPVAIANPGAGVSAPFLIRIATHCTDGLSHGLYPDVPGAPIESWFDYPL